MRRADRLFRIVRILRGGRLQTARMLAQKLEVSERTIYRDVSDLQTSGMPIEGEAGVGYTLRRDLDLPPLMFTRDERLYRADSVRLPALRIQRAIMWASTLRSDILRSGGRFAWTACRTYGCWVASSSRKKDKGSRTIFGR